MKFTTVFISLLAFSSELFPQQPYYPLTVGNSWTFGGFGPWTVVTITKDTIMANGKKYALVSRGLSDFDFQRQEGSRVYSCNGQSEHLLYDFSRLPKDTIVSIPHGLDTTDIILLEYNSVNLFGKTRPRWVFLMDWLRHAIDDEQVIEVVDSIGVTALSGFMPNQSISSAWIDGRSYVTTNVISQSEPVGEFRLSQNYPNPFNNPFNPITTIRYSLPVSSRVRLTIYNVLGEAVTELVNEEQSSGWKEVHWNAKVASGMYFYRLESASVSKPDIRFVQVKKMLLLK
jgi:hypothetical protein